MVKDCLTNKQVPIASFQPFATASRLTVCLPDSLDLTRCQSTLFWISASAPVNKLVPATSLLWAL